MLAAVILRSLRQYAFRNLRSDELGFETGVTAVVGPNASGKSNLLDACYLAASADLPGGRIRDALRWGEDEGFVAGRIERRDREVEVHVGLASGRKIVRLDGQSARRGDVARVAAAVRITPQDAELIHGGPSQRRGWLDDLLGRLSPRYAALLREYAKVLEQRNAGLRTGAPSELLAVFGDRLAELGDEVGELRARAVTRVDALARDAYTAIAVGPKALSARLLRSQGDRPLAEALAASAAEERSRGVTLVGPHRDDLELALDGRSAQLFGSRGEARTTALALRVAELQLLEEKHGESPILLLDDFSAELDSDRRAFLLDLSGRRPQALVSGTEAPPNADRIVHVRDGEVSPNG